MQFELCCDCCEWDILSLDTGINKYLMEILRLNGADPYQNTPRRNMIWFYTGPKHPTIWFSAIRFLSCIAMRAFNGRHVEILLTFCFTVYVGNLSYINNTIKCVFLYKVDTLCILVYFKSICMFFLLLVSSSSC